MALHWWSKDTIAVVTGANKGIGLEIVRQLAEQGLTVVLTARDKTRGQATVDDLVATGLKSVVFHQLEVSDAESVQGLVSWLKTEYGGIDILVNNAGVGYVTIDYDSAVKTFDTNYYGVKKVTAALLPLLRPSPAGGRIVNVTSRAAAYERLPSESIKEMLRDEDSYTEELADTLATKYVEDMKTGRVVEEGWLPPGTEMMYGESKLCLNVFTRALAHTLAKSQPTGHEVFVAGMCPGVTLTDLLRKALGIGHEPPKNFPMKSPPEGAETAVWMCLLPKEDWQGKSGKLFAENQEVAFGHSGYRPLESKV